MVERLLEFLRARMPLTAADEQLVRASVSVRRVQKGDTLQRAGEIATHGFFVAEGCLRSYSIDEKGREHVLRFAPEGWWLTDFKSMRDRESSTYFVDALEASQVVAMPGEAHPRFLEAIPGYAAGFAAGLLKMHEARERRLLESMSATAEQRYLSFLDTYPSIARRVPQHMLASYLGITPETLSRLRAQLARAKQVKPGAR